MDASRKAMPRAVVEPTVDQLNAILDGLGFVVAYGRQSAREFLRVWIRDWTMHKVAQALEQPEQEPVAWISVTDALPKSGVTVLACYRNRLGKLRRIRAHWIAAKTAEANSEDWDQCSEYDEATDTYYVTEGWYECIDNWGDYSAVAVSEGDVTHWMPLPEAPQEVAA
jgi:hypothetical protein